jgi:hypothetical protein
VLGIGLLQGIVQVGAGVGFLVVGHGRCCRKGYGAEQGQAQGNQFFHHVFPLMQIICGLADHVRGTISY